MTVDPSRPALTLVATQHPVDQLGSQIIAMSGRLAAATARWLLLVAEFDAAEGWQRFGLPSTARWLAHACGLSDRTSTDHVRVARALATHPLLAEPQARHRHAVPRPVAAARRTVRRIPAVVTGGGCRPTTSDIGSTAAASTCPA